MFVAPKNISLRFGSVWLCCLLFLAAVQGLEAQEGGDSTRLWSNRRALLLLPGSHTLLLDSLLPVAPGSLRLYAPGRGVFLSESDFNLLNNNTLILSQPAEDTLCIYFRTLPYPLHRPLQRKDRALIGKRPGGGGEDERLLGGGNYYSLGSKTAGADALDFESVQYSGSFARGVSIGNNQDLVLNSSLNLQIGGKLGDVEILGAISDNQMPLQPQGNTQQIQDFDRLFIQFKLQENSLIAGDYDLQKPKSAYFSNYFRRLQGGKLDVAFPLPANASAKSPLTVLAGGSFAVSRGSFARNSFPGEEGNQGPYRLRGNNGERFLIILAGTERVFIDGVLLTRGADQDYVIDYNQGEVRFTNKQLITKDKRIVIEFSYSDLNYLRSIYTAQAGLSNRRWAWHFNLYSEQDAKNQPSRFSLTDSVRAVLLAAGDDPLLAVLPGIQLAEEQTSDPIRYKMVDTVVAGITYGGVLVYSTQPDSAFYTARFSEVSGGGNYVRSVSAANGTVYQWLAPDPATGAPRGTHEPVVRLQTPRRQQMLETGLRFNPVAGANLSADVAWSNLDLNTFSKIGNEDNGGLAARFTYEHKLALGARRDGDSDSTAAVKDTVKRWALDWKAHYEYLQARFNVIEPYRGREFARDWNLGSGTAPSAEQLFSASLALRDRTWGRISYEWSGLLRDSAYFGYRHQLAADARKGGLRLSAVGIWSEIRSAAERGRFIRPRIDLSYAIKPLKDWKWGLYAESEFNRRVQPSTAGLLPGSLFFYFWKLYTELPSTATLRCSLSWQRRYDHTPLPQGFAVNSVADEIALSGNWSLPAGSSKPKPKDDNPRRQGLVQSNLMWNLQYRNLRIPDSSLTEQKPRETYLGRVEYRLNLFRNFLRWTTAYEIGAGQQQKIEYQYVEVPPGQGLFQWIDRNGDGIQQQNEFETAVFQDQARFIRVVVFTGEFLRSNNVLFNQSLDLDGQALRRGAGGDKDSTARARAADFFARWALRSNFQIDRRTLADRNVQAFNPFQLDVADTALVSIASGIRNTLFFNRSSTVFSLELGQTDDRSKTLMAGGFDTRRRSEYHLFARWTFAKLWNGQLQGLLGRRSQGSEFFPDRNYDLDAYQLQPQLGFMDKNRLLRITLQYKFARLQNRINSRERALSHKLSLEVKYTPKKTSLSASLSWVGLNYDGAENTPVEFAMTEGLKNGQNFLWSLSFSRYLSKDNKIQLFMTYEGRKTGSTTLPTVHTGRMQLRASF